MCVCVRFLLLYSRAKSAGPATPALLLAPFMNPQVALLTHSSSASGGGWCVGGVGVPVGRRPRPPCRPMFPWWGADPEKALRAKYAHEDEADAKRGRAEQELRRRVQAIQPTPSFTAEWFEMLEVSTCGRREERRTDYKSGAGARDGDGAAAAQGAQPQGRDVAGISGATPTLWDKETVAVRLLLEEGKLNVCLRLLYRHRRQATQPNFPQLLATVSKTRGMTVQRLRSNLAVYEGCLAKILACAYENVEVVQTTELSEAVEYAVYVLNEFCRGRCKDELGLLVPTCACYNLRAFALHMDQLGEKRVMLAFAHHRAVELVVELMHGKRAQVSWVREGEETRRVAARTGSVF